tara:strand:- start:1918 stop:2175 length:258 start_codon:yes stop_codon:yes gene_type:complete
MKITITAARNKRFIGKTITISDEDLVTIGRTDYRVGYGTHQPNKAQGDFKVVRHTLKDMAAIALLRVDTDNVNKGIDIYSYTIES